MKVTEVERKESTKHCCGNGCLWRDSAEHEEETEAPIDKRIAQNNTADADRQANGLLEEIVSRGNLNRAYKREKKNKGAGGVDGMKVDELLQQARELETQEERLPLYKEFQTELSKDLPYTFIAYIDAMYVSKDNITGLTKDTVLGHHGVGIFWNIYDWDITE